MISLCFFPPIGNNELPTKETIEGYMSKLYTLVVDNPNENESLVTTVRDIVSHLDYQG